MSARHQQTGHRARDARDAEPRAGARFRVGLGGSNDKYILVLAGEDGEALAAHAARSSANCAPCPGIGRVTSSSSLQRPELVVKPDAARAADLGVSTAAIGDALRCPPAATTSSSCPSSTSQRQVPINVAPARQRAPGPRACSAFPPCRAPGPGAALAGGAVLASPARRRSTASTACATSTSRSS